MGESSFENVSLCFNYKLSDANVLRTTCRTSIEFYDIDVSICMRFSNSLAFSVNQTVEKAIFRNSTFMAE